MCYDEAPSHEESSLHTEAAGSAPPDAFGPFRVLHQIGAGALGPVFRAYEPERDRLAAVKVFRLDVPPERAHQLVAEFERLIEAGLQHPGIAAPLATGLSGVVAYLAQEYFAGDSLDIVSRENGLAPFAEALRVARQLADALDFAADRDVEHGALNPRDVLLSQDSTRIVGFGVTRALERIGSTAPIRRPYTPPERVDGGSWDRRADIFSLAAILHELMWGRRLAGTGLQAAEALTEIKGCDLGALQMAFAQALAEDAGDRFSTATEFVDALESTVSASRADLKVAEPRGFAPAELMLPLDVEPEPVPEREPEIEPEGRDLATEEPEPVVHEPVLIYDEPQLIDEEPPSIPIELPDLVIAQMAVEDEPEIPISRPRPILAIAPSDVPVHDEVPDSFLTPMPPVPPAAASHSSSQVWPIGLAWVVGLAIGFGAGYTVSVRDRSNTPASTPAAAAPTSPVPVPSSAPPTEGPVADLVARPGAGVKLENAVAPVFSGRVVVRSTPPGARVFIDGRDRGPAPTTINDLDRGEHRVRVVRDGYTAAERRVVLTPSRPSQSLSVPLAKTPVVSPKPGAIPSAKADVSPKPGTSQPANAGTLVVESRPEGADVFVDARRVGTTPLTLPEVKAGDHSIRIERAGYRLWTSTVKVGGDVISRVTASLER